VAALAGGCRAQNDWLIVLRLHPSQGIQLSKLL